MARVSRTHAVPLSARAALVGRTQAEPATLAVVALAALATMAFSVVGLLRHHFYYSTAMDFAFFDQVVWNTSQGRWFETSFTPYNFLGQHVEPILLLFALLYRITPAPEWLILVQALAAGAAAILLYFVACRRLERPWLAALVAAAFLLSPSLHGALSFDYHSEALAPLFVFGGVLLLLNGKRWAGVAILLATLLLKEDAALLLIGLAVPL